jgi:lipopolysaccharide export LptBFGC system permease protein LptF
MKQSLQRKLFFTSLFFAGLTFALGSMLESHAQNISQKVDTGVIFPKNLSSSSVDFKLKSTGEKIFKVILNKNSLNNIKIKIYDIVGNLIIEDNIKPGDGNEKNFDFSQVDSQIFVVEVGNSKYNKTKSIYAQPPGNPREESPVTESQQ